MAGLFRCAFVVFFVAMWAVGFGCVTCAGSPSGQLSPCVALGAPGAPGLFSGGRGRWFVCRSPGGVVVLGPASSILIHEFKKQL